ncbi:MAG: substrate-binding domain-containing protein [Quadrisphaera sp.]
MVLAVPGTAPLSALTLRVVAEVTDLLSMAGLHLVVRRTTPDRPFHRAWREVSPAAVIGLEVPAADLEELRLAGVPAVSFDVSAFDEAIGTAQARHLLERGHTSLAYAAPRRDPTSQPAPTAAWPPSAAPARPPVLRHPRWSPAGSTRPAPRPRSGRSPSTPGVSAVCAFDDEHALAVLAGMAQLGLHAPADYAVIGAGSAPLSAVAVPPLTTVDPGAGSTAETAVRHVLAAVEGAVHAGPFAVRAPRVLQRSTA